MRLLILPVLLLSACTSVVPATALRLRSLSPMEADPAGFAVTITLPEGLDIEPNSARLKFTVTRADTGEIHENTFVLDRMAAGQATYRVAPSDLDALRAAQAVARQWKAEADDATSGSLNVTLSPCKIGAGPAPEARVSVGIRVAKDGPFQPLVRNAPISAIADPQQISNMGACSTIR